MLLRFYKGAPATHPPTPGTYVIVGRAKGMGQAVATFAATTKVSQVEPLQGLTAAPASNTHNPFCLERTDSLGTEATFQGQKPLRGTAGRA